MSEHVIEPKSVPVPGWLAEMKFCHIACDEAGLFSYCGGSEGEGEPPSCNTPWLGEALCTDCGRPTCPRCVQLSALDDALEDEVA